MPQATPAIRAHRRRGRGVWTSRREHSRLAVTVDLFDGVTRTLRSALGEEVERLGAIHGAPASLEFDRVYASAPAEAAGGED